MIAKNEGVAKPAVVCSVDAFTTHSHHCARGVRTMRKIPLNVFSREFLIFSEREKWKICCVLLGNSTLKQRKVFSILRWIIFSRKFNVKGHHVQYLCLLKKLSVKNSKQSLTV